MKPLCGIFKNRHFTPNYRVWLLLERHFGGNYKNGRESDFLFISFLLEKLARITKGGGNLLFYLINTTVNETGWKKYSGSNYASCGRI